jgi:hypothetical protein
MFQKCERFWSFVNSIKPFFFCERNGIVSSLMEQYNPFYMKTPGFYKN